MLPVSAISDAANKLRSLLASQIDDFEDVKRIKIGHPKETFDDMPNDVNHLNLFFYNVKIDGYPADGLSEDPFYVRLHCLITAVGAKKEGAVISSGENDLRLIGEVMRILHERPVLSVDNGDSVEIAQLQIVPHALDLDNLNHIWSTQGETAYRLSVAYEMALAPIPMAVASQPSALVGEPSAVSWGAMTRPEEQEKDFLVSFKPVVEFVEVDSERDDWQPQICLVDQAAEELHYVYHVTGNLTAELDILVAGKDKGKLKMVWNLWRRAMDNSVVAWQQDIADTVIPLEKEITDAADPGEPWFPNRIDPDAIDSRRIVQVKLPDAVLTDSKTWQAVLYAVREWQHEEPADSGNLVTTTIRSNPVLLHGAGP